MSATDTVTASNVGEYLGFDHIHFWVGNALQAASFYVTRFGFKVIAYKGLETGSRQHASYVLRQNKIILILTSTLVPIDPVISEHVSTHGDGVRDVAFTVKDVRAMFPQLVARGAQVVEDIKEHTDEDGTVITASVRTYGDTVHTIVQRDNYKGIFMPGYKPVADDDPLANVTEAVDLQFIDHIVGNQPDNEMTAVAEFYEKTFQFHRFWSVDDSQIHTEYSSLRSIVMTDENERVKMPINEPANGKRKSQIQEYVDYYVGAGVQHIALNTNDIIGSVSRLTARGVQFLKVPDSYYTNLRAKLAKSPICVKEDLDRLQQLHILIDYDDKGYLLQIFTKPVEDRPTLFFEVIQRRNHQGFGVGNFKSLFEAIEAEQEKRGNL